eukprot:scaffold21974_cov186-Skeletonema_dohrnii-CCMP3373.AAC.2
MRSQADRGEISKSKEKCELDHNLVLRVILRLQIRKKEKEKWSLLRQFRSLAKESGCYAMDDISSSVLSGNAKKERLEVEAEKDC